MQEHWVNSVSLEPGKRCWSVVWFPVAGSLGWKLNRKAEHMRHRIQPEKRILSKTWEVEKNNKNRVLVYITQVNDSFGAEEINKLLYSGKRLDKKQIGASASYNSSNKYAFVPLFIQLAWSILQFCKTACSKLLFLLSKNSNILLWINFFKSWTVVI